eukprot:TRINITY_DN114683_c0_g1_i1.p1 TRINITY_DN114683_c0_g1~~TRINITY_DN114683_c0_g1_i1.p1  ORF type:complete len:141 (+),score=24.69 TRINITY_DN114683_c0_g1_i1:101-523(+)
MAAMRRVHSTGALASEWESHPRQAALPKQSFLPAVNEAHTETVRVKELERELLCSLKSKKSARKYLADLEEEREKAAAQTALLRTGKAAALFRDPAMVCRPNSCRYAPQQRQGKHQVRQGDGRGRMLSRVFLNGEWTYVA